MSSTHMAHPPTNIGSLPQFYGETMADGTVVESPPAKPTVNDSQDALLRLPIQPHPAYTHPASPVSPVAPGSVMTVTPATPSRRRASSKVEDTSRWVSFPVDNRGDIDYRNGRQSTEYRSTPLSHRMPYVEEYLSEEDDSPRTYRRPERRHRRPPVSHRQTPGSRARISVDQERRSLDSRRESHEDYENMDPIGKPRYQYAYESEDDRRYQSGGAAYGGGGGRGPPRNMSIPENPMRLPWTMWMNSTAKNHFVAFIGEFVGTTMFLFFAFSGTQVANIRSESSSTNTTTGADTGFSPQVLQYIALVFGFSLMVNVWIFFRISGGLFNPAVTFAMLLTRAMTPAKFFLLLVAQLAGSIFASFLVSVMFPTPLNVRTTLSAETSLARGIFIEALLTAELVFTIFMLAKEKHKATFIAPVGIGLSLFVAELVGVYYTGGSLNPARSFGPCVVTGVFDREHWIYWVGPAIGACVAVLFYKFIKILEYEMTNPDQDADDKDIREKERSV
ncbi:unnamed protein product [Periconia digitata]|uniref:Aquaporin-like protein n=1 Tax=Periconia digitata TaxID=1303443 RepID=A0A9W4UQ84_9PLEO|nr:unnamed protein product [Periconia digitata]